jgi:heme oxygenase
VIQFSEAMSAAPEQGIFDGRTSVLAALRAATSEAHAELDSSLALAKSLTPERYARFLRASLAVVAPLEARIACWLGFPADGVFRTTALRADLSSLGAVLEESPATVPSINSLAEAMGAAYVVEGSALGGLVLARTVAKTLGEEAPRRYLSLRGEDTAGRWREFIVSLEQWGGNAPAHGRVLACEAARQTFAAYASAFAAAGAFA